MSSNNEKFFNKFIFKNLLYVLMIVFFCIVLCVYDLRWIIPSIILSVILTVYTIWDNIKNKDELLDRIEQATSDLNSGAKINLINSPIPLVLIETDGRIKWKSRTFVEEFQNTDMSTYLTSLVKEIKLDLDKDDTKATIVKQFNINKKIYKINGVVVKKRRDKRKNGQEYMLNLYFIDETKYNTLFDKYNNSKTCIGLAMIDNYEDIIQRAMPEEKLELLANIEKELIEWINGNGGLLIKTERDSFVFVFERQLLTEFEKDKNK